MKRSGMEAVKGMSINLQTLIPAGITLIIYTLYLIWTYFSKTEEEEE